MSLTSFLAGAPMTFAPGMSQSSTSMPDWYNSYVQGILGDAANFANQGAPMYPGQRVAGLTPLQTGAANTVAGQAGVGSGIAQQGVGAVNSALAGPNALQAGSPYLSGAASGVNSALGQANASQAAQPFLSAAGSPLAAGIGQFMSPFTNDVVNATNTLASRNFRENVLPGLQDQFTQAGQVYGGSRQGELAGRLGRDLDLNTRMADANILSQGFNTALGGAEAQAGINAGLAGTAANAANAAQNTGLAGAGIRAGLGATAGSLANAGQQTGIAGGSALGSLGTTAQNNALNQALVQNQFGQQQQANTQANLNTGYQDYLQQYYNPLIASQAMQGAVSGMRVPTGTTTYSYQPYGTGFSPLQQSVGFGNTIGNLLSPLFGTQNARGGHIRLARGGQARRPILTLSDSQRTWRPLALPSWSAAHGR